MSQSTAVRATRPAARPAARPGGRQAARPSPPLLVVGAPEHARSRAGLVIGCLGLLGLGLLCLLVLNVSLEKGAYVLRQQQSDTNRLMGERQALQEQLAALEAPQTLARRASHLGMVSAPNVAFVRTSDGRVLGVPTPGVLSRTRSVASAVTSAVKPAPSAGPAPAVVGNPASTIAGTQTGTAGITGTTGLTGTTKATTGGKPAATATSTVKNPTAAKPAPAAVSKTAVNKTTGTSAAKKPVTKKPVTKKPVTKTPVTKKPVTTSP
jgi:hypothetical protein